MLLKNIAWGVLLIIQIGFAENVLPVHSGPWDMKELSQVPQTFPASEFEAEPGLRPLFFQGEDLQGRETRVFAWVGIPDGDGPFPAMVLVHGGGGTAYQEWVKLWMDRGYAAIAMDTAGQIPVHPDGEKRKWMSHEHSGPRGWGGFDQIDDPVEDQWTYHAVAAVIRAHSLLRSYPQVDASRIGVTGISWGGYLTCIVAGVDDRFQLAVPVYGCGFLEDGSFWLSTFLDPAQTNGKWASLWDPRHYIPHAEMPMLFVNGTNDKFYWMKIWQKTYRAVQGPVTLCCKVRMAHYHAAGWGNEEIYAFADSILKDGSALPQVTGQSRSGRDVWVTFNSIERIAGAELIYTMDEGEDNSRNWQSSPMSLNSASSKAVGEIPEGTRAYFLNLIDDHGLISSSEYETVPVPEEN